MIFFSRKPKQPTAALPPDWPSPYHNKCSQPDCIFPNVPQTAKGVYPCRGVPGGFFCEGTYKISSSRAHDTERYLKERTAAKRAQAHAEEQRKRTMSELRRPGTANGVGTGYGYEFGQHGRGGYAHPHPHPHSTAHPHSLDSSGRSTRRTRDAPSPTYAPSAYAPPRTSARPSRPSDVGRSPPQLPPRPSYSGYRPSSSQVEAEYITDQIMMHLYPERQIQPRWI